MSPNPKNSSSLKSKFFRFSLIVLLSSIFVNYYLLNVDYDVDYDWSLNLPPAPVINFIFLVKRVYMSIPNYIFPPNAVIMQKSDFYLYNALREISKLEIADIVKQNGGKLSVKQLSELTDTNEESLGRLLRAVSMEGIFRHHGNGVYSNNRLSSVLRKDHPNTVKYFIESRIDFYRVAEQIGQTLKYPNGWDDVNVENNNKEYELVTPWKKTYGHDIWEYYDLPENKEIRKTFDRSMVSANGFMGDGIFVDYDWNLTENSTVVDVGGGNGGFLLELLKRNKAKGVIFDLPNVIDLTRKVWNEKNKEFLDRVELVSGSFFNDRPPKADVLVLRWILHDWSDNSAIKILKNLRSSVTSPSTRLVIIEQLLDEPIRDTSFVQIDLAMLCFLGKERTSQEFVKILDKSGWNFIKTVYCRGVFNIIEAVPYLES